MNLRNPSVKTLTSVLSFALAFAAVKYGMEFLFEQQAVAETVEQIKKIKEDGAKKHPELSASAAESLEAAESMTKSLDSETDRNKKKQLAAFSFFGFYIVNTSERSAFVLN